MKKSKTTSKVVKAAKSTAKKAVNVVKQNPTVAFDVVLGIAAITAVYFLIKNISNFSNRLSNGDPNISDNVDVKPKPKPSLLSITKEQGKILAQQLLDAMNAKEPFFGTDEKTIFAIFQRINSEDFKLIFNEFGLKDYNGFNSPPTGFLSNFDSYEKRNLIYWLKNEITPSDGIVYDRVKKVVEHAGFIF